MHHGKWKCLLFTLQWVQRENTAQAVSTGQGCESVLPLNATNSFVGKYASYLKKTVSD